MKKYVVFIVMIIAVFNANAQLEVNSSGNTGLKTSPVFNYALKVDGNNLNGINVTQAGSSANAYSQYGVNIKMSPTNQGLWFYGLFSDVTSSSSGWKYGVLGTASGSQNQNFGVYGYVPETNIRGAAIYGSLSGYLTPSTYGLYAGYFDGPVKVDGDLQITGEVTGVVLGTGTSQYASVNTIDTNANPAIQRLSTLRPEQYLLNIPNRELSIEDRAMLEEHKDELPEDVREYKPRKLSFKEKQIYSKNHYSLNADQLEEAFPDLVYENEDGSKSINYVEMVPILVQAINELKAVTDAQAQEIEALKGNGAVKKGQTRAATTDGMGDNLVMLSLGQNKPNPFGTTTSIDVSIPESVQKAFIYIYDLQGKKKDQVDITARGKQTIQLNASTFSDGMYLYSLIVDGKVVETRRMIVEK